MTLAKTIKLFLEETPTNVSGAAVSTNVPTGKMGKDSEIKTNILTRKKKVVIIAE